MRRGSGRGGTGRGAALSIRQRRLARLRIAGSTDIQSAVTYVGKTWYRPTGYVPTGGGLGLPLILRNPANDSSKLDSGKLGPSVARKFGASDYRMLYEGVHTGVVQPLANSIMYATAPNGVDWTKASAATAIAPRDSSTWEQEEICPDSWFYDARAGHFKLYYHGGNNLGPRQIGLMTSATGDITGLTRFSLSPILANGPTGSWDEHTVADAQVVQLGPNDYRMLYAGRNAANVAQVGYATSTDGEVWTKSPLNPVLPLGTGNESSHVYMGAVDVDERGRVHFFYTAIGADGFTQRNFYAYSDNWETWTRNQADVILSSTGVAGDPDKDDIGDLNRHAVDDGILLFTCMNRNANGGGDYGDGIGALDARGTYWLPRQAAVQPTRPGRAFTTRSSSREYSAVNTAAALLNSTVFALGFDFKMPPGNTTRSLYTEYTAFNQQVYIRAETTGKLGYWFRTPTNIVPGGAAFVSTGARIDDNQWHRILFVRRAAGDFEIYLDGVSVNASTTNPGAGVSATEVTWGNWGPLSGLSVQSGMAVMRQGFHLIGRAMTTAEEATWWNGGADGGTLPVTATAWTKFGSGGPAGPDTAQNGATYGSTPTLTTLVDASPVSVTIPGTTFTDSVAESGAASDSQSAVAAFVGAAPETVTSAESQTALADFVSARAETGSATDAATGLATFVSDRSESGSAAETQVGGILFTGATNDTLSAVDAESAAATFVGAQSESGTVAETETASAVFVGARAETLSAAETETSVATFVGTIAETGTATDSETGLATFVSARAESLTAAETEDGSVAGGPQTYSVTVNETGSASESQTGVATFVGARSESGTVAETQVGPATFVGSRSETLASAETALATAALLGVVAESGSATDVVASLALFVAAQADALASADSSTADLIGPNTAAEALQGTFSAFPQLDGSLTAVATLGGTVTALPALDGALTAEPRLTGTFTFYPQ